MSRGVGSFFLVLLSSLGGLFLDSLLHTPFLFTVLVPVAVAAALVTGYQAAAERRAGVLTPWEEDGPPEPAPPSPTAEESVPPQTARYRTVTIAYTPRSQELAEKIAQTANQMERQGYALLSFSVTPGARGILVFRKTDG